MGMHITGLAGALLMPSMASAEVTVSDGPGFDYQASRQRNKIVRRITEFAEVFRDEFEP